MRIEAVGCRLETVGRNQNTTSDSALLPPTIGPIAYSLQPTT